MKFSITQGITILAAGFVFFAFVLVDKRDKVSPAPAPLPRPTPVPSVPAEPVTVRTEEFSCGSIGYHFDTIRLDEVYTNEVYQSERTQGNLIAVLSAPSGFSVGLDSADGRVPGLAYTILSVPVDDCETIYLTAKYQVPDLIQRGIFAWTIGEDSVRQLSISDEYFNERTPYPHNAEIALSPSGTDLLITQRGVSNTGFDSCEYHRLSVLALDDDELQVLVELPETETLDDGTTDLAPYCNGLNFGWESDDEMYYDVYDATEDGERELIERRTFLDTE